MKKLLFIFVCLWGICVVKVVAQQSETVTLHFSHDSLSCTTASADDGHIYSVLSYPDCTFGTDIGKPSLPRKYTRISLPHSAEAITMNVQVANATSHSLNARIFPCQPEIPTFLGNTPGGFVPCDSSVYLSTTGFPAETANITDTSCAGQGDREVGIAVCPIVYYPTEDRYTFYSEITITISYVLAMMEGSTGTASNIDIGLPFYEYCVITNRSLAEAFTRLVSWRRQQGIDAGVVCVEDIMSNPYVANGDTVSSINDDAGKIRQYLQYAYNNGNGKTKSVLFGGDFTILPIRYGAGWNYSSASTISTSELIPSDLYFAELNTNWNVDGDPYYGEPNSQFDYAAELSVGRILCANITDVNNYTDKLLRYELNPGNGDFSYLKKALYTQSDQFQQGNQGGIIRSQLHTIFPIDTLISEFPSYDSENPSFPYGHDVINTMNERYHYVSWFGHGHPNAVTTLSKGISHDPHYGIFSVEGNIPWMENETGNGLNSLTNKDYPMIAYSIACTITPFDVYTDFDEFPNIGYSFTMGKDYGGPALIGNTREGWVSYSYLLQQEFNKKIEGNTIGEAQNFAKYNYQRDMKHWLSHSSNLIGCPNIRIWTDTPYLFYVSPMYIGNNIQLSGNLIANTTAVGVRDVTSANDSTYTTITPSLPIVSISGGANSLLTITGKNSLPLIMPLKLQNTSMHGKHYMLVKDMSCGSNIRSGSTGSVVFENDADYDIEFTGSVTLAAGTEIKKGASVKITPSNVNY